MLKTTRTRNSDHFRPKQTQTIGTNARTELAAALVAFDFGAASSTEEALEAMPCKPPAGFEAPCVSVFFGADSSSEPESESPALAVADLSSLSEPT